MKNGSEIKMNITGFLWLSPSHVLFKQRIRQKYKEEQVDIHCEFLIVIFCKFTSVFISLTSQSCSFTLSFP